jgi:hypothetical protein
VSYGGGGHRLLTEARSERGVVPHEVWEDYLYRALTELALKQVALVERRVELYEKFQAVTVARTVIELVWEAAMAGRTFFHSGGTISEPLAV